MLNLGKGHLAKPLVDLQTADFETFMTEFYGKQLASKTFVPEIDFTPAEDGNKGYFTFWKDLDGQKYRYYIRVSNKITIESDDDDEILPELVQNYPIYVSTTDKEGNDLELPTLTFGPTEGTRKARKVNINLKALFAKGSKLAGLPK
jgi:hypothetical protein